MRTFDRGLCRARLADLRAVDPDRGGLRVRLPERLDARARDVPGPLGVVLGALAGADDDDAALLAGADVRQDVVQNGRAALGGETIDDRARAAGERLRSLLVVEQRDDRDLGRTGVGGPDGTELHSSPPLWTRAGWIARRSCAWLAAGSVMRTRSSPTRRVSP